MSFLLLYLLLLFYLVHNETYITSVCKVSGLTISLQNIIYSTYQPMVVGLVKVVVEMWYRNDTIAGLIQQWDLALSYNKNYCPDALKSERCRRIDLRQRFYTLMQNTLFIPFPSGKYSWYTTSLVRYR